jgi:hypothetical protein
MKLVKLTAAQNAAVAQALSAVVSTGGRTVPSKDEIESVEAIQRHLFLQDSPLPFQSAPLPGNLAEVLPTPELRLQVVRLMAMLPPIDKQMPIEKVEVVEAAAKQLGVAEFGLVLLRRIALGQTNRVMFKLMKRIIDYYWSISGRPEPRGWVSLWWSVTPWFPGLRRWLELDNLLAKYRALEKLPPGTLGHEVHRYYAQNGFPIPGTPKSIPEGWARHEVYHIISNYKPSLAGELFLAGFIAGNTAELPLDVALPALVQLHTGRKLFPGPVAEGVFRADDYCRAMARGATMSTDLLAGWRLWEHADVKLDELRARYNLPAFSEDERRALAEQDAVLA